MGFPRQEYWSGLPPFLSPENLPNPGIKPMSPALAGGFFTIEPPEKPISTILCISSVAQSRPTLCNPTSRSTPGLPVHHQLPEFTQTHVLRSVMPSNHLIFCRPLSSCPQSFPASGSFPMSQLFASGGLSMGVSASTSVLPMNTQD